MSSYEYLFLPPFIAAPYKLKFARDPVCAYARNDLPEILLKLSYGEASTSDHLT
jgi:hypothetical protein